MIEMTSNLNTIAGLGHFVVLLGKCVTGNGLEESVRRLRPRITSGKVPPVVQVIGKHAIAATWGGAVIEKGDACTVVGLAQRARHDDPDWSIRALEQISSGAVPRGEDTRAANLAAVVIRNDEPRAVALTAAFRQLPLYRATLGDVTAFATDVRLIADLGIVKPEISVEALYHYLNFSCIPAPFSIFENVHKVPAGTIVRTSPGTTIEERYWRPTFPGTEDGSEEAMASGLREKIFSTVRAYRPRDGRRWGTFLSGGTDSSSITGVLASDESRDPVRTFSIGFAEQGYDELQYARIAARHFGADPRYRQVSEQDTIDAIPRLLEAYDEPYGNASAVPTFYCAAAAADEGVQTLLAGDGGDESFGGNTRYAKDAVYRAWSRLPGNFRRSLAARLAGKSLTGSLLENRVRHFVRRGALDNPERFYMEESFASDYFDELLSPCVRARVERNSSLGVVERHYQDCQDADELHRLMYVDLMMAIADNDLVKVQRASQAAGVTVAYPYLDTDLVEYAGRLHSRWKVKGLKKRYLFKCALRDLLPEQIINKRKQGFGLPIALWSRRPGPFRDLLNDTLRSSRAMERGWFEPDFITGLLDRHDAGGWDMSPELWRLLMLELWQREYVDAA